MTDRLRLVAWNIRSGGGKRAEHIADALLDLKPDLVALSEFRSTPPSQLIAARLKTAGFTGQASAVDQVKSGANAVMLASRSSLKRIRVRTPPQEPGRWLMAGDTGTGIAMGAMHIPNQHTGRKPGYHDAVVSLAADWRAGPAFLVGDTNSGQIGLDEEKPVFNRLTHDWFQRLADLGWMDGFRQVHGAVRDYTWYSHRNNGFRLDQIFINEALAKHLVDVRHVWPSHPDRPERRDGLSDHAALIADFAFQP